MKMIKCLTVRQPFAWLIVAGHKPLENRTWDTKHRGSLLIHAAARPVDDANLLCSLIHYDTGIAFPPRLPLGSIIGRVNLVDVVVESDNYWFDGPFAFRLERSTPIDPIPYRGQLGLFNVPWPMPVSATKATKSPRFYTPRLLPDHEIIKRLDL